MWLSESENSIWRENCIPLGPCLFSPLFMTLVCRSCFSTNCITALRVQLWPGVWLCSCLQTLGPCAKGRCSFYVIVKSLHGLKICLIPRQLASTCSCSLLMSKNSLRQASGRHHQIEPISHRRARSLRKTSIAFRRTPLQPVQRWWTDIPPRFEQRSSSPEAPLPSQAYLIISDVEYHADSEDQHVW